MSVSLKKLILSNFQSPGDIVMLTAAVRDLHRTYPGRYLVDVMTPCPALWENNPYVSVISDDDPTAEKIACEYPLIHKSNQAPFHFIHGFMKFLGDHLGTPIHATHFKGDIYISELEKSWISQVHETVGEDLPFWILVAGGKYDFTIKWWDNARYQRVVDHFAGRICFVQVGEANHHHRPIRGVIDLRGKTDLRQLVRLVYHAQGVLCPVTLLMHLAAAVETKSGMPKSRPCVVIAGGREPAQWEAYPHHQFIHTNGALFCCDDGGCWKSRTVPLGDGDEKDQPANLCVDVVMYNANGRRSEIGRDRVKRKWNGAGSNVKYLPKCLDLIEADEVIRRIDLYFRGGALRWLTKPQAERTAEFLAKE